MPRAPTRNRLANPRSQVHVQLGGSSGPVFLLDAEELRVKGGETRLEIELNAVHGTYGIVTSGRSTADEYRVTSIKAGSPAATDGRLKVGDHIRVVDGKAMLGWEDMQKALAPPSSGRAASDWPNDLFRAFEDDDLDRFKRALDRSGWQAATHTIYENRSDKDSDMSDDAGYYRLSGTTSGSWYRSQGIKAGMSVLEIAEKLVESQACSRGFAEHMKRWLASKADALKRKVSLVVFRDAVTTTPASGGDDMPPVLQPTRVLTQFDDSTLMMAVVDVLGPPPSVGRVPDLRAALAELDNKIGLKKVKEAAHRLVKLAQTNYARELNCEDPDLVPMNRLFLGNPGTGKTSEPRPYSPASLGPVHKILRVCTQCACSHT